MKFQFHFEPQGASNAQDFAIFKEYPVQEFVLLFG